MQNRVNSFSGFQPLKEVWLGDCYPESFYSHLSNQIQDAFGVITEWTKKDLAVIQQTLESLGVKVQRPKFTNRVDDYVKNGQLLKPPICPRDNAMTLGNQFYHLRSRYAVDPWQDQIQDFQQHGVTVHGQPNSAVDCLHPPSIVRMGRDIYVDYDTHQHVWGMVTEVLTQWAKHYRVHVCQTSGHSDAVFCPVAPGIIVATHYLSQYNKTFPNWQVFHLPVPKSNSWNGTWHIENPTVMQNSGFADHINQYAFDWVGNFKETVFEANLLVIDPTHVMAIKEDPQMFRWLEQHGINVSCCDFRCRSFWDGGLHCLTTDIVRQGPAEDYFPDRQNLNYLDWIT
jgi:hypothetical protein